MRARPDPRAGRWIAFRIGVVAAFLAAGLGVVAARAFFLQVLGRDAYLEPALDQYLRELVLRPRRGEITDRSGVLLAGSADARSVYVDPEELKKADPRRVLLRQAAKIVKADLRGLERKLDRGGRFVWLARRVAPTDADRLQAFLTKHRLKAIALVPERRRYYPKAELAGQLLGVVDDDGQGREGVELARDGDLQGVPVGIPSLRDGRGRWVLEAAAVPGREREGARIELTLDQGLQATAERALARAVTGSRALSGMAVVLDPASGEVLAMASHPLANANAKRTADQLRNRPVTDAFEPGSTVKAYVIASALDRGELRPEDPIDCGNGRLAIGRHVIRDHHPVGWAGASKVLAQSSNIGAARIGARLGREGIHEALAAFGFGERTGIGLPGEVRGQLTVARSEIALATQSFGQGPITATALQLTSAMGVLANGGVWVRPHVVRRVIDPVTRKELYAAGPGAARQVVSPKTAETVTRWLVGVLDDPRGTGRRARLDGWSAAGKTGTAQKVDKVSGGYAADRHFSSFIGFAPAEAPRIVVGVFIDEPRGEIYGGEVAAPAFREIAEYALRMMGVPPNRAVATPAPEEPVLAAAAEPEEAPPVEAAVVDAPREDGRVAVPALSGLPARAALRHLETLELGAELRGSGRVVGQSPPPGRVVERGTRVRMTLAPAG